MTREQWTDRCADRIHALIGGSRHMAHIYADGCAEEQEDLHGPSGAAWQSPEDVADDFMARGSDE